MKKTTKQKLMKKKSIKEMFTSLKNRLESAGNLDSKPDVDLGVKFFNKLMGFNKTEKKTLTVLFRERLEIYYIRSKIYRLTTSTIYIVLYFLIYFFSLLYFMVVIGSSVNRIEQYPGILSALPLSIEILSLFPITHFILIGYALFFNNITATNKVDIWFVLSKVFDIHIHIAIAVLIISSLIKLYLTTRIIVTPIGFFIILFVLAAALLYYALYFFIKRLVLATISLLARHLSKHVFINGYYETDLILYFYTLLYFVRENRRLIYSNITYKKAVIEHLDKITFEFSDFTNRMFSSKDLQFKDWVTKNTEDIISYMKSRKAVIFNANKKSLLEFERYCKNSLVHLLNGDWSKLKKLKHITAENPNWKAFIFEFSKSIIIGGVPILTVYLMNKYSLIEIATLNYLYFATIIWAAINLMLAIEPGIIDRIKLAKDMSDIIRKTK